MLEWTEPATMQNKKNKKTGKLFLIDGNSFCYRAYYAIRRLSNSKGEATNAIYGFITMLRKLIEDYGPDHLVICFDCKAPTFRHERYKEYKAHRKPMPDDLAEQMQPIKEFCRAYRYAAYELPGYEADDLLGTFAVRGAAEGFEIFLVTGDKDAMQLVNDRIRILNPHKEGLIYDSEGVRKRLDGLGPEQVIELMALMGDSSDNIPGVPGIGEKTALKLIQEFGSIENLYRNLDRIKSKSRKDLLQKGRESALLSRELAEIDTDVPIEVDWDKAVLGEPDETYLAELCRRYEFQSLLRTLTPQAGQEEEKQRQYEVIRDEKTFRTWLKALDEAPAFSFDTETTGSDPMRAHLVGLSFSWKPFCAYYIPVASSHHGAEGISLETVLEGLRPVLENPEKKKYGQNIKYDWIVMKRNGITLKGAAFDTMIASYLLNPLKMNHNLDDISLNYLGVRKITTESLIGKGKAQRTMAEVPLEEIAPYASEDADCVFRLVPILEAKMAENGLTELFEKMELPLFEVLARMEMNGVHLDREFLRKLSEEAGRDLEKLTEKIYAEAGEVFNINSPKQLSEILFEKLRLPVIKRTKTGQSTDVSVLEKLAAGHEMPRMILEYRERAKLKSTYLDALPEMVNPETGNVHTSYHQTVTATGRLSSSDPNLQNIPIKTEAGRLVRKAFIGRLWEKKKGRIFSADYSQVELRILAHFSEDRNLTQAFKEKRDIHRFTATLLYGVPEDQVTRDMRNVAKTINFSIIYGKTAYGLSQDLAVSISEADQFIENYFRRYAGVRDFLESQKERARRDGFLTTLLGRRAYFPEIHSKNAQIRQFAERAAINAPIQGTAADLIKLAMIRIQKRLEKESFRSLMIMQVHDELVFDAPEEETEKLRSLVKTEMEGAYPLRVPLDVDTAQGESWYKD